MKVRSEDLSKVRFPEGRRGYDADKVDAVLSEIIETLREYEAADEALHRTFIEAQRIKDEMIGEAQSDADAVRAKGDKAKAAAMVEAEELLAAAKEDAATRRAATEENVAKAKAEIERRLADAAGSADQTRAAADREASSIRDEATKDAEDMKVKAAAEAHNVVADAKKEAREMLVEAQAEHARLSKKVPQLRTAVNDIRGRLIELAESAQNELAVVDGMIDLAAEESVPEVVAAARPIPPQEAPAPKEEAAEEPDEAPAVLDSEALEIPKAAPDQSKETFYGSGLRRRLSEGAKSKESA
jgi:DivIVA domain-containing protein